VLHEGRRDLALSKARCRTLLRELDVRDRRGLATAFGARLRHGTPAHPAEDRVSEQGRRHQHHSADRGGEPERLSEGLARRIRELGAEWLLHALRHRQRRPERGLDGSGGVGLDGFGHGVRQ
jgi:hypothetical protein